MPVPLEAGKLNREVTLQRNAPVANALNEPVDNWVTVAVTRAARLNLSGAERVRAAEVGAVQMLRFQILWAREWSDLDATWRLLFEGAAFNVEDVTEIGLHQGLDIRASARAEAP